MGEFEKEIENRYGISDKEKEKIEAGVRAQVETAMEELRREGFYDDWKTAREYAVAVLEAWANAIEKHEPQATRTVSQIREVASDLDNFE